MNVMVSHFSCFGLNTRADDFFGARYCICALSDHTVPPHARTLAHTPCMLYLLHSVTHT
jgi:hypothetical protein